MLTITGRLLLPLVLTAALAGAARARAGADEEEEFVVIKAGRVITMAGPELRNVDVLLVDGKIRLVGPDLSYPKNAKVIDARNQVVMPGMIHPRTRWQLAGYSRSGTHGGWSAASEVFLSEIDFQPLLEAGFTAVCFYAEGSGATGRGSVYRTAGATERRDLGNTYLRITMSSPGRDKKVLRGAIAKARQEIEKVAKARKEWEAKQQKAKAAAGKEDKKEGDKKDTPAEEKKESPAPEKNQEKGAAGKDGEKKDDAKTPAEFTPPKIDPAVLPLVQWIRDKSGPPLLYEIRSASDFRHLEDVLSKASELPLSIVYLANNYYSDIHHILEDLGKRKVFVLMGPRVGTLPYTVTRFHLAAELALAGCHVVLLPASDSASGFRQHRVQVANLVRAGLPRDEALKSVTLWPARILGIADRFGSIEKEKEADLIFLDGDPLAPGTHVRRVMTFGEIVWEARQQP